MKIIIIAIILVFTGCFNVRTHDDIVADLTSQLNSMSISDLEHPDIEPSKYWSSFLYKYNITKECYKADYGDDDYMRYPIETITEKIFDCEDSAALAISCFGIEAFRYLIFGSKGTKGHTMSVFYLPERGEYKWILISNTSEISYKSEKHMLECQGKKYSEMSKIYYSR